LRRDLYLSCSKDRPTNWSPWGKRRTSAAVSHSRSIPSSSGFFHLWSSFWILTLLVLLGVIVLAGLDLIAIRRYGQRHLRQIQADRRAMIEQQIARVRSQRNGHR
jgi:LPS O-antigen subunit length determinant protein (WzzB/FepE family)